ncbi:MAG: hypothetical protein HQ461_03805, partial [Deltaproteobacteria bacterium]|nr:hypothetical protein [Deltaproteobacteria bacterium]
MQSRFSSPGQSQSILTAAPSAVAAPAAAPAPAAGVPAPGAADGAPQPFLNDRVTAGGGSNGANDVNGEGEMQPISAALIYQG